MKCLNSYSRYIYQKHWKVWQESKDDSAIVIDRAGKFVALTENYVSENDIFAVNF
jgi:hypothetical protein